MEISRGFLKRIAAARRVYVLTGAGISAESGVPTFRGGGQSAVWKGMPFDEISSAKMVRENLDEVWKWFDYRRGILAKCKPNPAHLALVELEKKAKDFALVTKCRRIAQSSGFKANYRTTWKYQSLSMRRM